MNAKYLFVLIVFLSSFLKLSGQGAAIGQWRDHLPYNQGRSVVAGNGKVFCSTPFSVFYFDTEDNSLNRMNSITGLNDVGVEMLAFSKKHNALLIAYSNTNLDLIKNNRVINMPDILKSNAVTPEEKTIHDIIVIDDLAYISCGFGVVVLDIDREEVRDTWYIGEDGSHLRVYGLALLDTLFYAATENGLLYANSGEVNLAYFQVWNRDMRLPFPNATYSHIVSHGGTVILNKPVPETGADTVMFLDGNEWKKHPEVFDNTKVMKLRSFNNQLYLVHQYYVNGYDENLNKTLNIWTYGDYGPASSDIASDDKGVLWIADAVRGLVRRNADYNYTLMHPNGPADANVYGLAAGDAELWMVPGGMTPWWSNLWIYPIISTLSDNGWTTITRETVPAFDSIRDILAIAIDPFDSRRVFISGWLHGVSEFFDHQFQRQYHVENSSLQPHLEWNRPVVKVAGIDFDSYGNLWATNSGVNNILSVRQNDGTPDGKWRSFHLGSTSVGKDIGKLLVDSYNQKWILSRLDRTIFVYNDNNTIDDPTDDQFKILGANTGNGNLPGNKIYSIAEDLDGEVWVGTDAGVAVFYSPENIFTQYDYDARQILIPRNDGTGLADILFEFETITAIAVDGSNRKWIGTDRSGVFLISPDGMQQIHHFTAENSPLLSNSITTIAIDHKSGEVYFGTSKGLISYKSTSTQGGATHSDVYAYPNPVRPGYNGLIAVKGLVASADVRITDINGMLVYKVKAEGGQAIWDGRNIDGKRVQTGVYLVFATNEDGSETHVTKILFVN